MQSKTDTDLNNVHVYFAAGCSFIHINALEMFSYSYYTCVCVCDWERESVCVLVYTCAGRHASLFHMVSYCSSCRGSSLLAWKPGSFPVSPPVCPVHPGPQVWAVSAFSTRPPPGPTSFCLSGEDFLVGLFLT